LKARLLGARAGAALRSIASQVSGSLIHMVCTGKVQAGGVFTAGTGRRTNSRRTEHSINTSEHYLTS